MSGADPDPQRLAVYAAEDALLADIGRRFRRWTEVEAFVESVLASPAYLRLFPDAPLDVALARRSRNATASLALPAHATLLIRDGSWNVLTLLHELAHLIALGDQPHGPDFVATELALVREFCSFDDYVALRTSFEAHTVAIASRPLASGGSPD